VGSFLAWVDYSAAERERMQRAIALLGEHEARDELGIGTIRDTFSETLFPGTSTIQTRLRYFLFIPWIYHELEARRHEPPKLNELLRRAELALTEPLKDSPDSEGNFGAHTGEKLKRMPSNVYWTGLRRWGILRFPGSQADYHRALPAIYSRRGSQVQPDDAGVAVDRLATWHERMPAPPEGFPEGITFRLSLAEAAYIQDRLAAACPASLISHLALHGKTSSVWYPWFHPDLGSATRELRAHLDLARRFSAVMHGASLLYNLMLAEISGRDDAADLAEGYRTRIDDWAISDERDDLGGWKVAEVWTFVAESDAVIPRPTQRFVEEWMARLSEIGPDAVAGDALCRRLVQERERRLKGARSRFSNKNALAVWGGKSGSARLDYRWKTVQRLLNDLHESLTGDK
jgi:hypothetical protein